MASLIPELVVAPMLKPIQVNSLRLANRFVMPAMQRSWCLEGSPTPRLVDYFQARAKGGVGLIISEACAVDHPSATQNAVYARLDRRTAAAWRDCIKIVKNEGSEFFFQLWHEGAAQVGGPSNAPNLSPSGLVARDRPNGRGATVSELDDIRDSFARSAEIAREIGASGVELHACHGYLLDQFLWSETNLRDDEWGGFTVEERGRYVVSVVEAVRDRVGPDFPISIRLSQWKEIDYQARIVSTPTELASLINCLEQAGIDMFHASTRRFWTPEWPQVDGNLGLAGWMKSCTSKPVIAVGSLGLSTDVMSNVEGETASSTGVRTYRDMVARFGKGEFDLMAVGRGLIGTADLVDILRRGDLPRSQTFKKEDLLQDLELPDLLRERSRDR